MGRCYIERDDGNAVMFQSFETSKGKIVRETYCDETLLGLNTKNVSERVEEKANELVNLNPELFDLFEGQ